MRKGLFLLLLFPACGACAKAAANEQEDMPSIELLEYLAEYAEDENGRLLDPMEPADATDSRSYSYREYMQQRTDQ
jgi:hypothetical protein